MSEENFITLEEHENRRNEREQDEYKYRTRLTNIKCQKCDGVYRYIDSFMALMSSPPKKEVICDKCKDTQYISI